MNFSEYYKLKNILKSLRESTDIIVEGEYLVEINGRNSLFNSHKHILINEGRFKDIITISNDKHSIIISKNKDINEDNGIKTVGYYAKDIIEILKDAHYPIHEDILDSKVLLVTFYDGCSSNGVNIEIEGNVIELY